MTGTACEQYELDDAGVNEFELSNVEDNNVNMFDAFSLWLFASIKTQKISGECVAGDG